MTAVLWFGPVSEAQRRGATVRGASDRSFTCSGDVHPNCAEQIETYRGADGRYLPRLLEHYNLPADEPVVLGAFSNGGSAVKRILLNAADRAQVRAVALADATYELWSDAAHKVPGLTEGYLQYALEALDGSNSPLGPKLFLATASANANNVGSSVGQPSGSQTLARLASAIGEHGALTEGASIPDIEDRSDLPAPVKTWQRGGVVLADYGMGLKHAEHATKLAPVLWPALVEPWVVGGGGQGDRGGRGGGGDGSGDRPTLVSWNAPAQGGGESRGVALAAGLVFGGIGILLLAATLSIKPPPPSVALNAVSSKTRANLILQTSTRYPTGTFKEYYFELTPGGFIIMAEAGNNAVDLWEIDPVMRSVLLRDSGLKPKFKHLSHEGHFARADVAGAMLKYGLEPFDYAGHRMYAAKEVAQGLNLKCHVCGRGAFKDRKTGLVEQVQWREDELQPEGVYEHACCAT